MIKIAREVCGICLVSLDWRAGWQVLGRLDNSGKVDDTCMMARNGLAMSS